MERREEGREVSQRWAAAAAVTVGVASRTDGLRPPDWAELPGYRSHPNGAPRGAALGRASDGDGVWVALRRRRRLRLVLRVKGGMILRVV